MALTAAPVVLFVFWIFFAILQVNGLDTVDIDTNKLTCLINYEREKLKLEPLTINSKLNKAAKEQADFQAETKKMSHSGKEDCNVGVRADRHDYRWLKVSENVAFGFLLPDEVVFQWMCSETHRRNIEDPTVKEMGIAATWSADPKVPYWAHVFGKLDSPKESNVPDCAPYAEDINNLKRREENDNCPNGNKLSFPIGAPPPPPGPSPNQLFRRSDMSSFASFATEGSAVPASSPTAATVPSASVSESPIVINASSVVPTSATPAASPTSAPAATATSATSTSTSATPTTSTSATTTVSSGSATPDSVVATTAASSAATATSSTPVSSATVSSVASTTIIASSPSPALVPIIAGEAEGKPVIAFVPGNPAQAAPAPAQESAPTAAPSQDTKVSDSSNAKPADPAPANNSPPADNSGSSSEKPAGSPSVEKPGSTAEKPSPPPEKPAGSSSNEKSGSTAEKSNPPAEKSDPDKSDKKEEEKAAEPDKAETQANEPPKVSSTIYLSTSSTSSLAPTTSSLAVVEVVAPPSVVQVKKPPGPLNVPLDVNYYPDSNTDTKSAEPTSHLTSYELAGMVLGGIFCIVLVGLFIRRRVVAVKRRIYKPNDVTRVNIVIEKADDEQIVDLHAVEEGNYIPGSRGSLNVQREVPSLLSPIVIPDAGENEGSSGLDEVSVMMLPPIGARREQKSQKQTKTEHESKHEPEPEPEPEVEKSDETIKVLLEQIGSPPMPPSSMEQQEETYKHSRRKQKRPPRARTTIHGNPSLSTIGEESLVEAQLIERRRKRKRKSKHKSFTPGEEYLEMVRKRSSIAYLDEEDDDDAVYERQ